MRYAIVIIDGSADEPRPELGNQTPLAAAEAPALNTLAAEGALLKARTVPEGCAPGSDVACLSVLGYNPSECYTGRAPLEAAAMDITLSQGQSVFRANTVTIVDDVMDDYAAGHITTDEAHEIISLLDTQLEMPGVKLHPGVQYRHACVIDDAAGREGSATPPHDITGQSASAHMPGGPIAGQLADIMARTRTLLADCAVNQQRIAKGAKPVTQLWLWGGGVSPTLQPFIKRFGVTGGIITAVDLLRGIACLAGLEIIDVPGATGFYDTNYQGKGAAALKYLNHHDLVVVHVEAPDEAGHNGATAEKVRAIENIDKFILAPLLAEGRAAGDLRILAMPDHPTPISIRTHTSEPVPTVLWGPGIEPSGGSVFTEAAAAEAGETPPGWELMQRLTR